MVNNKHQINSKAQTVTSGYKKDEFVGSGGMDSAVKIDGSPLPLLQSFDEVVSEVAIPEFLQEHKTTLRFPETVRFDPLNQETQTP